MIFHLFSRFVLISLLAFGGGGAALPLVERLAVSETGWLSPQDFAVAVACGYVTPGPVLITATFVGYRAAGLSGAVAATVGVFLMPWLLAAAAAQQLQRAMTGRWQHSLSRGQEAGHAPGHQRGEGCRNQRTQAKVPVHGGHQHPPGPPGSLEDRAGVVRLEGDFEVRCRADGAPPVGSAVTLAVRPENLLVEPGGNSSGGRPNTWSGRVVKAEFLGTHSIYRVQVGGQTLTAIELGSTPNFPDNASVSLHIPPERVSLMASTST